jgi:hypothetical protein
MLSQKSRLLEAIDEARELAARERLPEVVDLLDLAAHASIAGPGGGKLKGGRRRRWRWSPKDFSRIADAENGVH